MTYRVNNSQNQSYGKQIALKPSRSVLRALLVLLVLQSCAAALILNVRQSGLDKHQYIADDCLTGLSKTYNTPEPPAAKCRGGSIRVKQKV